MNEKIIDTSNKKLMELELPRLIFDELEDLGFQLPLLDDYPYIHKSYNNINIVYFDLYFNHEYLKKRYNSINELSTYAKICVLEATKTIEKSTNCLSPDFDTLLNFCKTNLTHLLGKKLSLARSGIDNKPIIGFTELENCEYKSKNSGFIIRVFIPYIIVSNFIEVYP